MRLNTNSVWLLVDHVSLKKQVLLLEEVQKLNRENAEKSGHQITPEHLDLEAGVPPKDQLLDAPGCNLVDYLREDSQVSKDEKHELVEEAGEEVEEVVEKVPVEDAAITEEEPKLDVEDVVKETDEGQQAVQEEKKEEEASAGEEVAETPELPDADDDQKEPTYLVTR